MALTLHADSTRPKYGDTHTISTSDDFVVGRILPSANDDNKPAPRPPVTDRGLYDQSPFFPAFSSVSNGSDNPATTP